MTAAQPAPFHRSTAFRPIPRSLMWIPTAQQLVREAQLTPSSMCAPLPGIPGSGVAILDQLVPSQCSASFSCPVPQA